MYKNLKQILFSLLQVLLYDQVVGYIIHISHILAWKRKHEYHLYFDIENKMLEGLSCMHIFMVIVFAKNNK